MALSASPLTAESTQREPTTRPTACCAPEAEAAAAAEDGDTASCARARLALAHLPRQVPPALLAHLEHGLGRLELAADGGEGEGEPPPRAALNLVHCLAAPPERPKHPRRLAPRRAVLQDQTQRLLQWQRRGAAEGGEQGRRLSDEVLV